MEIVVGFHGVHPKLLPPGILAMANRLCHMAYSFQLRLENCGVTPAADGL